KPTSGRHHLQVVLARDREGQSTEADDERRHSELLPLVKLLLHLLHRADEVAFAPASEGHTVEDSLGAHRPQTLEPAGEIALVLSDERVPAEAARDIGRIAAGALACAREHGGARSILGRGAPPGRVPPLRM